MKYPGPKTNRVLKAISDKAVASLLQRRKAIRASSFLRILRALAPSCSSTTGAASSPESVILFVCIHLSFPMISFNFSEQRKYWELMSYYLTYSSHLHKPGWLQYPTAQKSKLGSARLTAPFPSKRVFCSLQHNGRCQPAVPLTGPSLRISLQLKLLNLLSASPAFKHFSSMTRPPSTD